MIYNLQILCVVHRETMYLKLGLLMPIPASNDEEYLYL